MSFNNKVVIVSGASFGIGAATAVLFAKEGADVALVARTQPKLEEVAKQIEALGRKALVIVADLSKEDEVAKIVPRTIQQFGRLDVLVNNAGIFVAGTVLSGEVLPAYDKVMQINVRAVIQLTTLAAPHLAKTKGNIINVSSVSGIRTSKNPSFIPYYISKAALNHFSKCAALELASSGIRVNIVSPGPVDNEFTIHNNFPNADQHKQALLDSTALGFIAKDGEIGDVILFLASDKAKSVTGSNYIIDNGYILK